MRTAAVRAWAGLLTIVAVTAASLVSAGRLQAQSAEAPPSTPPTTRILNCTNGGCHAQQLDHKFLHGPTAVQACDACHEYVDPAKHAFALKRQGRQLCDFCHIDKTGTEGTFVHKPVADGKCTECHDPHGSNSRRMLKADSESALCTKCHTEILHGSFVHKPVEQSCTACHRAHTSDHAKLLSAEPRALCLTCHESVAHTVETAKFPHQPAQGDCLECHRPHASDHAKQLKNEPEQLCGSCHEGILQIATSASHPHAAVTDARACLNCHTPHGSDNQEHLVKDTVSTCLQCHDKPIVVDKDRTIPGVPELANPEFYKHGPVVKGGCSGCHDVHGGTHTNLLVEPYPQGFYQAYSDQTYALCFKCHDKQLVLAQPTDKQTGFRSGTRNLHAVHVDKSPQGRSCRACHNVHASRSPSLLADKVTFGEWQLPVNYKKSEYGGSCAPGCHKPATYDRRGSEEGSSPFTPGATPGSEPTSAPDDTTAPPAGADVGPPSPPK